MRRLQHYGAVAELLNKTVLALDCFERLVCNLSIEKAWQKRTGIGDLGDLVALEAVPALVAACVDELFRGQMSHVLRKGSSTTWTGVTYINNVQGLGKCQW